MTLLLWLAAGLIFGVIAERIIGVKDPEPEPAFTATAPQPGDRSKPKKRRRWGRIIGFTALFLTVALLVGSFLAYRWANNVFESIETVDVTDQLTPHDGGATNYLLVGSDNGKPGGEQREGVDGSRSDTVMVLRIEDGKAKMLSLNRDLWVMNPATGQNGRLNATYNAGPGNLIQAVTENFGIPIHHYIEIDFISFAGLVDAFDGIDINFEHPAFDLASGLDVKQAGLVHLDGQQAMAYVRSRHYHEVINGEQVPEGGLPDVNRTMRQQAFLRAIMAKAGTKRNPLTLMDAADKMSTGLVIDDDMTMIDAARFAWDMGRLDPVSVPLPVAPRTTSGGAAVLDLDQPEANLVLSQFK